MAELRRFGFGDFLALLLTLALAGGVRAWYLHSCCDGGNKTGPLRVQEAPPPEMEQLVGFIKDKFAFSSIAPLSQYKVEATAHLSPGYPWIRGYAERFLNSPLRSILWGQCVLGALTAGFYFLFARRAFGSLLVATLAGVFCAFHPFWVIDTGTLDDGVLSAFLLAAAVFFAARGIQTSGALSSLLYGLALAGLALVRAALLPFGFVALAWFLLKSREVARGWLCAAVAFLGFVIGLAPWTLRNWDLYKMPIPVVDTTYLQIWEGNHPGATGGPVSESDYNRLKAALSDRVQPQRYFELLDSVQEEVTNYPVQTVKRRLWAGLYFFFGEHFFSEGEFAEPLPGAEMPQWLERSYPGALAGTMLGMLVLGVLGWRWTYGWRNWAMPSSLAVMWVALPYILTHAEALSGPRLPLDGVLLTYSAFALCCFVPGVSAHLLAGVRPAVVKEVVRR